MSTTTIRLEDALKARLAAVAERTGKTPHAFILEAIQQNVEEAELDDEFHRLADQRWQEFLADGKSVPWSDVKAYVLARAQGKKVRKPAARKMKR